MYIVYIIESQQDYSWYTGFTTQLQNRLSEHNNRKNKSTRDKLPWKIIYAEAYVNKKDALGRERFLKSGSGKKFIKKQISNYLLTHATTI